MSDPENGQLLSALMYSVPALEREKREILAYRAEFPDNALWRCACGCINPVRPIDEDICRRCGNWVAAAMLRKIEIRGLVIGRGSAVLRSPAAERGVRKIVLDE